MGEMSNRLTNSCSNIFLMFGPACGRFPDLTSLCFKWASNHNSNNKDNNNNNKNKKHNIGKYAGMPTSHVPISSFTIPSYRLYVTIPTH